MNVYEPIAVIGLACRFPDAPNIETFKKNLVQGHDAIRPMSAEDMQREGINPDLLADPNFVNAGTLINNPANFDCAFFGLSPKEAELMDPQHRLFLEESRKLLDVANLSRGPLNIGIYAGCRQSTYQMMLPPIQPENITQTDCFQQLMGNDKDYLATRIAYQLNLTGPAMSLQTACSTSLVTVHQACQALRNNECDAALAGGVGISFPQGVGYKASPGMIFSNDGKCRPFSADGSGIVAGNGLGIIALKRLKDAIKDGDTVHAVIKGSALSNDGKAKLGFTAPGKTGQQKAIKLALANSGINPNQVGLLEAHGTGTPLGDPIEVQAIAEIYRSAGVPKQACAIGSVKGNVGHLDTAAGIASLIKAILSVRDDILPPTLHCKPSNPNIAFETSPFYLVTEQQAWPKSFKDRIAAVSSFGIGGTNCHMLVQQAPTTLSSEQPSNEEADRTHILAVSNHCKDNLSTQINHCISATQPELLAAQCRTLAIKRQHYPSRIAVVGKDKSSLQQALSAASIHTVKANPKTVWLFSGQGSQITGMGKAFYSSHCVFKEAIDLCCHLFATEGITHLTQIMFESSFAEQLDQTYYTQPALFTWQYAMAKLLLSWGIKPNIVVGHSIGEFAASVVSGHLVLESAIRLVAHRASLMQNNVQLGSMLAIRCSEENVNNLLNKHRNVCIAARNNEERFTLSGPEESINNLLKTLTQEEIPHQRLSVQRAFHSSAMEQIKEPFYNHSIPLNSTSAHTTMYSTLTAKTVEKDGLDNNYWFQQLRQPVQFHQTITALSAEHPDVVLEIGPDGSFSQLLKNQQSLNQTSQISKTSQPSIAALAAELYSLGYNTPLEEYYAEANRNSMSYAQMPAIEFSPTRCWPDNAINVSRSASQSNGLSQSNELDETMTRCNDTQLWQWKWLALPPLYQQNLQKINKISDEKWCLVGDHDFSQTLASFIESSGQQCVICEEPPHTRYDRIIDTRLLNITLSPDKSIESLESAANQLVDWGRYAESYPECQIITLVSNASHLDNPQQGNLLWPLLNLCRTYANEKPHLSHCCLDITDSPLTEGFVSKLQQVIELGTVLLLKNDSLYSLTVDSQSIAFPENPSETPSDHHTLIAGLGTVGLGLAQWLADRGCQKLAFLIRRAPNSKQQKIIDKLSSRGISIHVINADITSKTALSTAFDPLDISIDRVFHTAHSGIEKLHPLEDIKAFSGSLPVKIQGSVNLYQLLKSQPLKLYCMFSSATSVMAMPGASGYATANAWQDAYSAYLRSNGVKAVTVSWGQLALSKEAEHITQVDKTGITALNSDQAFSIMTHLINSDISGASPIIFDPVTLGRTLEILPATYPCLKPILRLEETEKKQQTLDLQTIATFTGKQKEQAISEYIHQLISDKLKFKYHQLNPEQSLTEQGVDSLVFLELVQIINQQLKLSLPSTVGYEFGTIHSLAAHITSQLTHDDIAFCEQKAKSQMAIVPDPSNRYEPFPLTDLQQAFWIGRLDGLSLGSVSCHQYVELELDNLDCARLESAWNTLIQRHELMRCVILPSGQNQIIQHIDHYSVEHRDLTQLTKEQRAKKLESIRNRMSFQVFNPEVWPLFELSVSQLSESKSRVHLDIDLLIFDIQSFRIIYAELAALLENEHTQFPELELSFRDYILAEKKLEESADWLEAKAFWMDRLATIPNAPQLPIINSLNTNEPTTYRTLDHRLSPSLWQQLRKFASKFALTPSSVLLTAYTQALALYSKSAEFTLNITYFNRKNVHEQIMDVCGDFTSLMLLPVASHANQQFAGEAKRIQNDLWDALKHRDFNGIRVMRELGRHKESGADKIEMPVVFTSMIGIDFDDPSRPDWPLMSKQVFEINQTPQVWIDYQASEYGGALMTRWFIADNLFEDQIIEGVFSTYTRFLEQLANQESQWQTFAPDLRSQQDQHIYKLLTEHQPIDDSLLMPQLLQRQVKALPDSPALICQNTVIDYRTLGVHVNTLAHYLIKQGLPPSSPVIVLMPKQALSLVAAFAIQSAGGCYVPVNSEYDNDRLQMIISELSPFAILTVGQQISAAHECPVINLKQLDLTPYDGTPPHVRQTPDELAYIIYTSGSTGHPKGVMLNHRMPINTLTALSKKLSITDKDRTLSLCACHHDMSIFDSYGIMTNGGSVIFPDADKLYDPEHWLSLIAAHQPTIINAVPAFISLLLDALESKPRELQPPRHIMMGGDWIPISLVNRINTLWPACKVQSIGGPTETAIVSAYYPVTTINPTWSSIPYGKPLSNQSCYILSPDGRDCPVGIPGEICTGGMALSLGYWQDDILTNKRYKMHPTQGVPIFHTGDLGCIGKDGNIEILGRMDSQINHNGLRIEPGEIEAAINQYQGISEAVVIYAGQPRKQLQGFITKTTNSIRHEGVSNAWIPANNTAHSACLDLPKGFNLDHYAARFAKMEQLSIWVMLATIQQVGLLAKPQQTSSTLEILKTLNVAPHYQKILMSWIDALVAEGFILKGDDQSFTATHKVIETQNLDQLRQEITQQLADNSTSAEQRLWSLYTRCIYKIDQLLTGDFNPLSLMFEDGKTDFAESHYRENIVSQHFNHVAGKTANALLQAKSLSSGLRILEFGAGIGSVTHDILKNVPTQNFSYDFTDISPYFLDNAKEMFKDWPQMRYSQFNINQEPGIQQFQLGTYDLIIGANVLHDAINVHTSIAYLRRLLKPDGHLMLVEGTLNPKFQMVSLGFVEGLSHYEDERLETHLPMISAPLWKSHLKRAGFRESASFPPQNHDVEKMNYHVIIAENNGEESHLDWADLNQWLRQKLPEYMLPTQWHHLDKMPLSLNGKTDRVAMAKMLDNQKAVQNSVNIPLQSEHSRTLASIWQDILNTEVSSDDANFFSLGGDSLLMTRLSNKIQNHYSFSPDLVTLLRHPILSEQAKLIETALLTTPRAADESCDFEEGII